GGSAADEIYGGLGDDDLFGGPGDDKISGDAGGDNIDGEEGNDSVGGGADNDYVVGGEGFDSITGGPGVDHLDSEDQLKDTYVNCDNAPGQGEIDYDKGLDIPFDCRVVLAPTVPLNVTAAGGKDSITVSWAPPEFDGNASRLTYEIAYRVPGAGANVPKPIVVPGTETSYTFNDLAKSGLYYISMRSVNEEGASASTPAVPVAVGGAPSPPQSISSVYISHGTATLSWVEPLQEKTPRYEVALRVKDKRNRNWLAWASLPGLQDVTSIEVGDDLRILNGRVYQFRVRTVTGDGQTSNWILSSIRYVGNLTPPSNARILRGGKTTVDVAFELTGLAWTYNASVTSIYADVSSANYYYGIASKYASVQGSSYQVTMTGLPTINKTADCAVGVGYLDAAGSPQNLWSPVTCPAA
ncbi:MAG: fibronectin type III domain-containing protein, partial [Actinomycetota bacterium]